jgi:hypothetical protein
VRRREARERLGEDDAGAVEGAAGEPADGEVVAERSAGQRSVGEGAGIPAADPIGRDTAPWARRVSRRGGGTDDDSVRGDGEVIDAKSGEVGKQILGSHGGCPADRGWDLDNRTF